jgi:hypothetical protein
MAGRLKNGGENIMRILALAVSGALLIAVGGPVSAAKKKVVAAPKVETFEACESKALAQGLPHGQTGHNEFVRECMGERPRGRTY